jgi:hypothetical protein
MHAVLVLLSLLIHTPVYAFDSALDLKEIYANTVDRKLTLPAEEQHYYAEMLLYQLQQAGLNNLPPQYVLMIDRNSHVQAALLFWLENNEHVELIGASPVSTGKARGYEYFETPIGLFEHTIQHPDFRAEGTKNKLGLKGYGEKGMRVFDFGWVNARKTWQAEVGKMRLQLHSTDFAKLEPKLGTVQSRGCIRIPAALNKLLDHYGILDADYEAAVSRQYIVRILDPAREPTSWSGRYMIVVDSRRVARPEWSPIDRKSVV